MDEKMIKKFAKNYKMGTFTKIAYRTDMKIKAAAKKEGHNVSTITTKKVKFAEYNNLAKVKAGHESGEIAILPSWQERVNDFMVKHKTKGNLYVRFTNVDNANTTKQWFIDGKPATKEEVEKTGFLLKQSGSEIPIVQCVGLENVISLGGVC